MIFCPSTKRSSQTRSIKIQAISVDIIYEFETEDVWGYIQTERERVGEGGREINRLPQNKN
jgi:hypothetical protein